MTESMLALSPDLEIAIEALVKYGDNPEGFVRDIIGAESDEWHKRAWGNLLEHHFLAIKSGSGVGKTWFLAVAILWFLFTRPYAKVPCTAPSQHQLYDILWAQIYRWMSRSPILSKFLDWTQTRIAVRGHEPEWYAVARTSKIKPGSEVAEGLQGFHDEKNLMFILDEASGIPDAVYPAVEGALTGEDCYCIMTSNPTRTDGFFHDIFANPKMRKFFKTMEVSCIGTPRVSLRYIEMMANRYGVDHPIYKIKVLGDFADADIATLIPPDYLEEMVNNSPLVSTLYDTEFGLDVGRTMAASVLCIRRGFEILKWDERHKKGLVTDTLTIVRWVIDNIVEFEPTRVKIDATGLGAGVYDTLKETYGDMIIGVIGAASPAEDKKDQYLNLRAQGYWELRDIVPKIYCEKWPDRAITELGDIRSPPTLNQRLKIESKDDMLARALRSPDYADAMYMAFLDSQLCGEIPVVYKVPLVILDEVRKMKKVSLWDMGRNFRRPKSRWSGLDG